MKPCLPVSGSSTVKLYLGGRMNPCLPVSGSSTVKLYLMPAPPFAQSSLPPGIERRCGCIHKKVLLCARRIFFIDPERYEVSPVDLTGIVGGGI